MQIDDLRPNETIAASVVKEMTSEQVVSASRMATGDQNFVFSVKTTSAEYVIRMTDINHKYKFQCATTWQKMLLPLGVPLAEFIKSDLDGKYSPFPTLLMMRLPGDDLINIYPYLTDVDKKNLANEMVSIQALCTRLPEGPCYGILDSYDVVTTDNSWVGNTWYEFLLKRLEQCRVMITKLAVFNPHLATQVMHIAKDMQENLDKVRPTAFLWDASERNVIINHGKISGIVDVDEICFGDPLFVIALTSTCLEFESFDTLYTDYWAAALHLDQSAQARLNFYRLFYAIAFMRKHLMQTTNSKKTIFDTEKLMYIFQQSLARTNI